ncbi:MAG: YceH family protein, partial [Steroidobacteraceae bacterium]
MKIELSAQEARVIGCLIEKEISTPDQYPLSINALTNACNQKSNRDPVFELDDRTVQEVVDGLMKRHLVSDRSGYGGRVTKYKHLFCNTQFGSLQFTEQERGIVCELLLRGSQTPGELRARTARLCRFNDSAEVDAALENLARRADGPFVMKLERAPGEREARFAHLFSGTPVV